MESQIGILWMLLLWGVPAVIFLVEILESAWRRLATSGAATVRPAFTAGFSLRRPHSVLRERHRRKVRPTGRTAEINKYKDDPYDL